MVRQPLCISDVLALAPDETSEDSVIDWMSSCGFRGGDIARVVRSLSLVEKPSVEVVPPSGAPFEIDIERVIFDRTQAIDLYGATEEWMASVSRVYETQPRVAAEMAFSIVSQRLKVADPLIDLWLVNVDMLPGDVEMDLEIDCDHQPSDSDEVDSRLLLASAIRHVDDIKEFPLDPVVRTSKFGDDCVAPLADGVCTVAQSIGLANAAAQLCLAYGRHHPVARKYVAYVSPSGELFHPREVPEDIGDCRWSDCEPGGDNHVWHANRRRVTRGRLRIHGDVYRHSIVP